MKILKHFTHVSRKYQPNRNIISSLLQFLTKHEKIPVKKWSGLVSASDTGIDRSPVYFCQNKKSHMFVYCKDITLFIGNQLTTKQVQRCTFMYSWHGVYSDNPISFLPEGPTVHNKLAWTLIRLNLQHTIMFSFFCYFLLKEF